MGRALSESYMPARKPSSLVRWPEPDFDTFLALTWLTALFFFLVAVVSAIGEILGWWDLIGEIGMGVGTTVSVLVTLIAVGASAGREQVDNVGQDVRSVGGEVRSVGQDVRSLGQEVGSVGNDVQEVHSAVEANGEILVSVDSKLDKLDDLDRVQLELDRQTGVLEDIRDAL